MAKCTGREDYECMDGTCVYSEHSCPHTPRDTCADFQYDYVCPDGECVRSDAGCLRPCGTIINGERYQYPCDGYTTCRASNGHDCPSICSEPTPVKCARQNCVKNEKFCNFCHGFRCDNGDCTHSYLDECNEVVDCADGSDEWKSTCDPFGDVGTTISIVIPILVCTVIVIIVVTILVFVLIMKKRRPGAFRGRATGGGGGVQQRPVVTSGVQPQAVPMTYVPPTVYQPQPYGAPTTAGNTSGQYAGQPPQQQYGAQYGAQYGFSQPPGQPYSPAQTAPPGHGPPPSYDELSVKNPG